MSVKKMILYRILDRARSDPRWMKQAVILSGIAVLGFVVIAGFLAILAINSLMNLASAKPDTDLIALRELIANKALVLTEAQKAEMLPLVKKMSEGAIPESDRPDVKKQIYGLLEPDQRNSVDAWKRDAAMKSGKIETAPQQLIAVIERYTGFSMKSIQPWTDALSSWWKVKKPEDSAGRLADELKSTK